MDDNEALEFKFSTSIEIRNDKVSKDEYQYDYFTYLNSPIFYKKYDKDSDILEKTEIGEIELVYLHGNKAYNDGLDIVDICDDESQELYDYVSSIFSDGLISEEYNEMSRSNDVLVLDKIRIEKSHQGKGYGLIISKKMIELFGYNCGAILIKPFPLQFSIGRENEEKLNIKYLSEKFSSDFEVSRKKILEYWKKLSQHCVPIKINNSEIILCIPQSN
jgi:hypothetical protein